MSYMLQRVACANVLTPQFSTLNANSHPTHPFRTRPSTNQSIEVASPLNITEQHVHTQSSRVNAPQQPVAGSKGQGRRKETIRRTTDDRHTENKLFPRCVWSMFL